MSCIHAYVLAWGHDQSRLFLRYISTMLKMMLNLLLFRVLQLSAVPNSEQFPVLLCCWVILFLIGRDLGSRLFDIDMTIPHPSQPYLEAALGEGTNMTATCHLQPWCFPTRTSSHGLAWRERHQLQHQVFERHVDMSPFLLLTRFCPVVGDNA